MAEELLRQKQLELDNLQKSFDDFIASSRDYENELEGTLELTEKKVKDITQKKEIIEEKWNDTQRKLNAAYKDYELLKSDIAKLQSKETSLLEERKHYENLNEELSNQLRILEATEDDLRNKLSNAEEQIVFLETELEDCKLERQSEIRRLEETIQDLQSAVIHLENKQSIDFIDNPTFFKDIDKKFNSTESKEEKFELFHHEVEALSCKVMELEELNRSLTEHIVLMKSNGQSMNGVPESDIIYEKDVIINGLNDEVLRLKAQVLNLKMKINDLEEANSNSAQRISTIEALTQMFKDKNDRILQLEHEISHLKDSLARSNQAIDDHQTFQSSPEVNQAPIIQMESSLQIQLKSLLASDNLDQIKQGILHQHEQFEMMRRRNSNLLAKIQSLQGNIQVGCRVRPANDTEVSNGGNVCIDATDESELLLFDSKNENWKSFKFDRVWGFGANQVDIFSDVEPMMISVTEGFNACILAYGQTGSGKTFTMEGFRGQYGVSFRAIQRIFEILEQKKMNAEHDETRINRLLIKSVPRNRDASNSSNGPSSFVNDPPPIQSHVYDDGTSSLHSVRSSAALNQFEVTTGRRNGVNGETLSSSKRNESNAELYDGVGNEDRLESGSRTEETASGIIDLDVVDDTFEVDEERVNVSFGYKVDLSMMEIYNEQVFDLLGSSASKNSFFGSSTIIGGQPTGPGGLTGNALEIRQGLDGSVSVPGLQVVSVSDLQEAITIFNRGSSNRATGATSLNEHSSRSHSILLVEITTWKKDELPTKGRLYLVDLAGSERVRKSGVTGMAMKEAQNINRSLSALGDVMEALDQKSRHVPYRNSKLTYLLQNCLGGNSKTMMIVTICPTDLSYDETLFTLQFATRVRNISFGPIQKNSNRKNLEKILKNLKGELKKFKQSKMILEENVTELKKDAKKTIEKSSGQYENRIKGLEESRKTADQNIQYLHKQLQEISIKYQDEVNHNQLLNNELETSQKNVRKAMDHTKDLIKENEKLSILLKASDKEKVRIQMMYSRNSLQNTSMIGIAEGSNRSFHKNGTANSPTFSALSTPTASTASLSPMHPNESMFNFHEKSNSATNRAPSFDPIEIAVEKEENLEEKSPDYATITIDAVMADRCLNRTPTSLSESKSKLPTSSGKKSSSSNTRSAFVELAKSDSIGSTINQAIYSLTKLNVSRHQQQSVQGADGEKQEDAVGGFHPVNADDLSIQTSQLSVDKSNPRPRSNSRTSVGSGVSYTAKSVLRPKSPSNSYNSKAMRSKSPNDITLKTRSPYHQPNQSYRSSSLPSEPSSNSRRYSSQYVYVDGVPILTSEMENNERSRSNPKLRYFGGGKPQHKPAKTAPSTSNANGLIANNSNVNERYLRLKATSSFNSQTIKTLQESQRSNELAEKLFKKIESSGSHSTTEPFATGTDDQISSGWNANGNNNHKMISGLTARAQEALLRHQERMEKRRERLEYSKKSQVVANDPAFR